MKYNWKLIRICGKCGREYEQNIENYLQLRSDMSHLVVMAGILLSQRWKCSDCVLGIAKEKGA